MKKSFLPLVLAAAMSLSASAQLIPNTFNYQGVCDKSEQEITVTFEVVKANGMAVYQEEQNVTTTKNGSFTAVIGAGEATLGEWNSIDWAADEYQLISFVDGVNQGSCAFQAVPYANVAAYVVGLDETQQDVLELVEDNMSNKAAIAQLQQDFANVGENLEMLVPVVDTLLEGVDALNDGLAITQQDVLELVEDNMSNKAAIAQIQQDNANVTENLEMLVPVIDTLLENVDVLNDGLATTQQDVIDLTETVRANAAAIALLEAANPNVGENLEMLVPVIDTLLENVDALQDGLANTQQDVLELVEDNMSNKAAIADVNAKVDELAGSYEGYTKDLEETLMESFGETADRLIALEEGLGITQGDVMELVEDNMSNKAAIAQLQADYEELAGSYEGYTKDLEESLAESFGEAHDWFIQLEEGLATTQGDVMELVEDNMSNKAGIAQLQQDLANVLENLDMTTPILENMLDGLEAVQDGLSNTQQDVLELVEDNMSNKAAIAELTTNLNNAGENMQAMGDAVNYLLEAAEGNEEQFEQMLELIMEKDETAMMAVTNLNNLVSDNAEAIEELQALVMEQYETTSGFITSLSNLVADQDEAHNQLQEFVMEQYDTIMEAITVLDRQVRELQEKVEALTAPVE